MMVTTTMWMTMTGTTGDLGNDEIEISSGFGNGAIS
jgi:hypothetical protein